MRPVAFLAIFFYLISASKASELAHCPVAGAPHLDPALITVTETLCLFSQPLVVGASVSAGYLAGGLGPSSIMAKKLNDQADIQNISHAHKTSLESLQMGKNGTPYNKLPTPSVVMGLDLFFWDAAKRECGADFITKTNDFFQFYQDKNVPMIIGKLPKGITQPSGYNRLNGDNPCTDPINELLEKKCTLEKNCILYDLKDCFQKLKLDAKEKFGEGKEKERVAYLKEKMALYFVDDIHPSRAGNEYCSQAYIEQKAYQALHCRKE